jgi:hypothetical protein
MDLPCREHQVGGIAQGVDKSMDFPAQSAARSANRLVTPLFLGAGSVLIGTHNGGVDHHVFTVGIASHQSENAIKTPLFAHRLNR